MNTDIFSKRESYSRGGKDTALIRRDAGALSERLKAAACPECMSKPCDCSIQTKPSEAQAMTRIRYNGHVYEKISRTEWEFEGGESNPALLKLPDRARTGKCHRYFRLHP